MSEDVEYFQVGDLKPYLGDVFLKAKIVEKGQPRLVSGGTHQVSETLVGDESGCIFLNLWDDKIKEFEEGNTVHVENGYVSVYRESMRLTAGKYGTVTKIEEEIPEVNTENNLSDQQVEQRQRRYPKPFGGRSSRRFRPQRYSRRTGRRGDWKTGYKKEH